MGGLVRLGVAAIVFVVAYTGGAYDVGDWSRLGLVAWWAVAVIAALGAFSIPFAGRVAGTALLALALLALSSATWADAPARAVTEFQRTLAYLGVFVLVLLLARRGSAAAWSDGLALGLVAVAAVALVSRFFAGTFSTQEIPELLPAAAERLSFPVGYWNGLAILVALAVPLLLRGAVAGETPWGRGAAVAAVPAIAAVLYLTSSRGGVATAIVGTAAMLALARRRWAVAGATTVGFLGAAGVVAVLLASDEGAGPAVAVVVIGLLAGGAWAAISRVAPRESRLPAWAGWAVAGAGLAVVLVALVAADPISRFETFKAPPEPSAERDPDFLRSHLVSAGGSGRWQFWSAAVDAFRTERLHGRGAGSYEAWWAQHGTLPVFARNAHSEYLETAAELGLLGLAALVAFLAAVAAAIASRLGGEGRDTVAGLAGAFTAFAVALGIDWAWQLGAVAAVGLAVAGLLTGPATTEAAPIPRFPLLWRSGMATFAVLSVVALAVPLLATTELERSRDAVERGDAKAAAAHALRASEIEPWSPDPRLQLALVQEQAGELRRARASLQQALSRDPIDWRLWLVDARLRTKVGDVSGAAASLARARMLNPRSPLWSGGP